MALGSNLLLGGELLLAVVVLRYLYVYVTAPAKQVPGPWLARLSRPECPAILIRSVSTCTANTVGASGLVDATITDRVRLTGPIVRIAPNEFSFDSPEASEVIYRSRGELRKVGSAGNRDLAEGTCSERAMSGIMIRKLEG